MNMSFFKSKISVNSLSYLFVFLSAGLLTSCNQTQRQQEAEEEKPVEASSLTEIPIVLPAYGNVVEVTTEYMDFIMPEEIPSGWTTFRYKNESQLTHFISLDKMPLFEGKQKEVKDFEEVAPVFQDAMDLINAGKVEEGFGELGRLPAWFPKIVFTGGVGLVSPGESAQSTVYLEPGLYLAECYVKTAGKFHPMVKQFKVTEEKADATLPEPELEITISGERGIELAGNISPGLQTIAVHFENQKVYENFMEHDVHLAKLNDETAVTDLNEWMNWADPEGLETPAPATFLGGVQQMPAGSTAYFTVNLEPGQYALVAEVPDPLSKGLLKTFTVSPEQGLAGTDTD